MKAQNQAYADSLEIVHRNGLFEEKDHMRILADLVTNHSDPDKVMEVSNELIQRAEEAGELSYVIKGYVGKGQALRLQGNYPEALENFYDANERAIELDDPVLVAITELNIGDVFATMENFDSSIEHYRSSITMLRKANDSIGLASAMINLGDLYIQLNKPDSALIFLEEAEDMMKRINDDLGIAYSQGNIGISYALEGRNQEAERYMNSAVEIFTRLGDSYAISAFLPYISDVYIERGEYDIALNYSMQSLKIAQDYGLKEQLSDANLKISQIYEALGDTIASYRHFKDHVVYKDSIRNLESVQKMADIRTDFEVAQKQLEVDLLNQQRRTQRIITWSTGISAVLLIFLVIGVLRRYRYVNRTTKIIEEEKNRSDMLLLNILPSDTAIELKDSGRVQAKRFESVSVMFTDFQGFTRSSQDLSPEALVKSVDFYFSEFDKIIGKYGLEKIKTIGDSYMCAGGLPFPSDDHPEKMILAAFEILEFMEQSVSELPEGVSHFDTRIGINTGTVVAGVVGTRKFAYDIWGDTVNVAARMESNSEPGKLNISEYTYELVKDRFHCEPRGKINVKNHGEMNMYYVIGKKA